MTPRQPFATVPDLGVRRAAGERAVVRTASAPVRHVTAEFLAALNCREAGAPLRPVLRAV
jgi:hypothetical protein